MKNIEIRRAESESDRAAVYRLRYELYVEGQGLFHDVADHEGIAILDEILPGSSPVHCWGAGLVEPSDASYGRSVGRPVGPGVKPDEPTCRLSTVSVSAQARTIGSQYSSKTVG